MGTFDDLSDEEKTRALLQFLQHHQQLERENESKPFQDSVSNFASIPIRRTIDLSFKIYFTSWIVFSTCSSTLLKYLFLIPFREIASDFYIN